MRIFQDPPAPEWATYTNDGRMDKFKVHKRLSDAKSAMTYHQPRTNQTIGIALYHWENSRWDLSEFKGGTEFSVPFHLGGKFFLSSTHPYRYCEGQPCVIHNAVFKLREGWSYNWREDRVIMEQICTHGVGHPDPNQMEWWKLTGNTFQAVHGCDGCCR